MVQRIDLVTPVASPSTLPELAGTRAVQPVYGTRRITFHPDQLPALTPQTLAGASAQRGSGSNGGPAQAVSAEAQGTTVPATVERQAPEPPPMHPLLAQAAGPLLTALVRRRAAAGKPEGRRDQLVLDPELAAALHPIALHPILHRRLGPGTGPLALPLPADTEEIEHVDIAA